MRGVYRIMLASLLCISVVLGSVLAAADDLPRTGGTSDALSTRADTPEPDDAVRAMQEAFAGSEFWWKRTEEVQVPRLPLAWLGEAIGKFFNLLWKAIEPVLEAIGNFFRWIWYGLRNLQLSLAYFPGGTLLISLILLALLGYLAWKIHPLVWEWLKSPESQRRRRSAAGPVQAALPEASLLLDQAAGAVQAGQYREAIRFAFLALLAGLQHRGLLRYDSSRTNREYLFDLRGVPDLAAVFRDAARPYERAWYGQLPVTSVEAEELLGRCRRLVTSEGSPL